jgi:hypothetical protein
LRVYPSAEYGASAWTTSGEKNVSALSIVYELE